MPGDGIPLGDILADSGYAHRDAEGLGHPARARPERNWSRTCTLRPRPPRHPRRRHHRQRQPVLPGHPRGRCWNSGPLARDATPEETAAHDTQTAELARYKLGKITADDTDGYHRVMCPAVMGKIRCPLRPASMRLDRQRPEILTPPEHPPACCARQTLTVPPDVAAKTRQKHDYPSAAHRRSYARRTGAERTFSTAKDPASNNIARGWCRLMGLAPLMLWLACLLAVRNQRILTAWDARQDDNARRAAAGLPAQHPPPAPQDPHRPRHRSHPAPTPPANARTVTRSPQSAASTRRALPGTGPPGTPQSRRPPARQPRCTANVRPKREDKSRSNVKTSWSPVTESNRRPSPYHACQFRLTPSGWVGLPQVRGILGVWLRRATSGRCLEPLSLGLSLAPRPPPFKWTIIDRAETSAT